MSKRGELPVELREFLSERVRSIEVLETLVTLHGEQPKSLTDTEITGRVRLDLESVREAIADLTRDGLVQGAAATGVRYHARDGELNRLAGVLAESYKTHRVELLVLISNQALHRVRKGALDTFSEAFRLRGPKKDG